MTLEATSPSLGLPSLKVNAGITANVGSWKSAEFFRINSHEWRVAEDEHSEPFYTVRHLKLPSLTRRYLWGHHTPDVIVTRGTLNGPAVGSCRIRRSASFTGLRDTLVFYADSCGHGTPIGPTQKPGRKVVVPALPGLGKEVLHWKWRPMVLPSPSWKLLDSNGSTVADYSTVWGTKKMGRLHWKQTVDESVKDAAVLSLAGMLQDHYLGQGTW